MSAETHRWTILDPACGKPAWHMSILPTVGDRLTAEVIEWPDGRQAMPTDLLRCGSCLRPLVGDLKFATNPANWRARRESQTTGPGEAYRGEA